VSAGKLKLTRSSAADYPEDARAAQISGWVELEFTVTKEGSVRDVKVTASQPKRTFDSAAVSAVRRSRYEPVLKDGQPVEQRAAIRVRFTLQNP
jgi:protein TonB